MKLDKAEYEKTDCTFKHKPANESKIDVTIEDDPAFTKWVNEAKGEGWLSLIIKNPIKSVKFLYYFFIIINYVKLLKGAKMTQSTLDTIKGIIRALAVVVSIFGVNISPNDTQTILTAVTAVWALVEVILGYISNNKVTPKT